jgi:hypothetical protein
MESSRSQTIGHSGAGLGRTIFSPVRLALLAVALMANQAFAQTDALPSWNDTTTKKAILEFVA